MLDIGSYIVGAGIVLIVFAIHCVYRAIKADNESVDLGREEYTGQIRPSCPMCGLRRATTQYDANPPRLVFTCDCGYTWDEATLQERIKAKSKKS